MSYVEHETKVLGVDVESLSVRLFDLGAIQVFNDDRVITHFDSIEGSLAAKNSSIKLTEEGTLKLSYTDIVNGQKETIKLKVSRKQEAVDMLAKLGFIPISEVTAHRTSFEWDGIDFDIDQFSGVPSFLEIDLGDSDKSLSEVIELLDLDGNEKGEMSTREVCAKYGVNYFEVYKK
jgi:adenylate cyclase class IV